MILKEEWESGISGCWPQLAVVRYTLSVIYHPSGLLSFYVYRVMTKTMKQRQKKKTGLSQEITNMLLS